MRRSVILVPTFVVGAAVAAFGMLLLVQVGGPQDSTAELWTSIPRADGVWETVARVGPPGHAFDLAWNPETRVVRLHGVAVTLGGNNVILVDGVGSAEGMQIVGTRRVADPRFTMGDYAALLRQSEELRDYQLCDSPLPDDAKPPDAPEQYLHILREHLNRVCEDLRG